MICCRRENKRMKATEHEILVYSPEIDLIARHERAPAGQGERSKTPTTLPQRRFATAWSR